MSSIKSLIQSIAMDAMDQHRKAKSLVDKAYHQARKDISRSLLVSLTDDTIYETLLESSRRPVAQPTLDKVLSLKISELILYGGGPYDPHYVVIRRMRQRSKEGQWSVIGNNSYTLSQAGTWSRKGECRFDSLVSAYECWEDSEAKRELIEEGYISWTE